MLHLKLKEIFGKLPTSEYQLFDGDTVIGRIQVRHKPSHGTNVPEKLANHIYYEILPEHRSKGYGKEILRLGLEKAKEIGLSEVFITCMEDNLHSKKIIESNGGIFIDDGMVPMEHGENKKMLKYKISL